MKSYLYFSGKPFIGEFDMDNPAYTRGSENVEFGVISSAGKRYLIRNIC